MLETSARLLRLLSLLQARPEWTGAELAEEQGVTARTVRRDIERLRELGYPVNTTRGAAGGYRLGEGRALPPLLLDEDEAAAAALALRLGGSTWAAGLEEPAASALAKLRDVMPTRLHGRIDSVRHATEGSPRAEPIVPAELLNSLAITCYRHERLRFDYRSHTGHLSHREVEPYKLVSLDNRWYLLGWDIDRADWRTFRLDRLDPKVPTGPRFAPRELPERAGELVTRGVRAAVSQVQAVVRMRAPAARIAERVNRYWNSVAEETGDTSLLTCAGDSVHRLAVWLGTFDVDFEVLHPPELRAECRRLAARFTAAASPGPEWTDGA
jgi:predicted DNA-binding transcriptional regulator YafY